MLPLIEQGEEGLKAVTIVVVNGKVECDLWADVLHQRGIWDTLLDKRQHRARLTVTWKYTNIELVNPLMLNPSSAEVTFVKNTRMQKFLKIVLTLKCWYSLDSPQ